MPYDWRVGVDNAFGVLTGPAGERHICESVIFAFNYGVVIDVRDGSRRTIPADRTWAWQDMDPEAACALGAIPAPALDPETGTRRVDPFHVERHRSVIWQRTVELVYERALPCGHSLRAFLQGRGRTHVFLYQYDENPEVFASTVNLRAGDGLSVGDAVRAALAAEAGISPDATRALALLLRRTSWAVAIPTLERRIASLPAPGPGVTVPPHHEQRAEALAAEQLAA
jgi:hypothetical protein